MALKISDKDYVAKAKAEQSQWDLSEESMRRLQYAVSEACEFLTEDADIVNMKADPAVDFATDIDAAKINLQTIENALMDGKRKVSLPDATNLSLLKGELVDPRKDFPEKDPEAAFGGESKLTKGEDGKYSVECSDDGAENACKVIDSLKKKADDSLGKYKKACDSEDPKAIGEALSALAAFGILKEGILNEDALEEGIGSKIKSWFIIKAVAFIPEKKLDDILMSTHESVVKSLGSSYPQHQAEVDAKFSVDGKSRKDKIRMVRDLLKALPDSTLKNLDAKAGKSASALHARDARMAPQQAQQQPVPQQQAVAAEGMIIDGEPVELNEQILNEVVWETISAVFATGGAAISAWIVSIYTIVKNVLAMAGDAIAKWIKGGFAPTPIPTKTATDNIPSSVGSGVIKGGVVATPNIGRHSVPQVGDVTVKGGNSNTPNIKTGLPTIGNKR